MKPTLTPWFSHATTIGLNWVAQVLDRVACNHGQAVHRPDLIDIAAHTEIAGRFRSLAEQDVQHLALLLCQEAGEHSRYSAAQRTGELCRTLCTLRSPLSGDAHSTPEVADLAMEVAVRFAGILREASAARGSVWFDFNASTDAPLTDGQEPWTLCDPNQPVSLVAIPAYTVNETRLSTQVVFTGTPDSVEGANSRPISV